MALLAVPPKQFKPVYEQTTFAHMRLERRAESNFTDWRVETASFALYSRAINIPIPVAARSTRVSLGTNIETSQAPAKLRETFGALAKTWREDTGHLSSTLHKAMHPAYQQIIGLGPQALPLILQELKDRPNFWFWALRAISGEDPVQQGDNVEAATNAWIKWGFERGLLVSGE